MQEMKRDQGYTFHDSSESEDDNITSVNHDTHLDEQGDGDGTLKVPRINVSKTKKISDRRVSNYSSRSKTSRQHAKSQISDENQLVVEDDPKHPWTFKRKEVEPPEKPPKRFTDTYFRKLDVAKDKKTKYSIKDMPADAPYPLNVYERDYLI